MFDRNFGRLFLVDFFDYYFLNFVLYGIFDINFKERFIIDLYMVI